MPVKEFVVQLKSRKNRLTLKTRLFVFDSWKGDNGFENILKYTVENLFSSCVLIFDDSCYVDAKLSIVFNSQFHAK